MATDISGLRNKIENDGATDSGLLRAEEFNTLVKAVIENQDDLRTSIKGIRYKGNDMPIENGIVIINDVGNTFNVGIKMLQAPPVYVAKGSDCIVRLNIINKYLADDPLGVPATKGSTIRFYNNGVLVGSASNVFDSDYEGGTVTKEVTFNYKNYITDGENNIYIELDNEQGSTARTQIYTVNSINISLVIDFNTSDVYTRTDTPKLVITPTGINTNIYISIDGTEVVSGDLLSINIPKTYTDIFSTYNTHGVHKLSIYATAQEYPDIRTNTYTYNYLFGDDQVTSPIIISSISDGSEFEEYSNVTVDYIAYKTGANEYENITISVINESTSKEEITVSQSVPFVNNKGTGSATISLFSSEGNEIIGEKILRIQIGDYQHDVNINIIRSSVELSQIGSYVCYLSSNNRSNTAVDKDVWMSENIKAVFGEGFEFTEAGSGWNKDEDGNTVLNIKKGRGVVIDYQPFKSNPCYNSGNNEGTGSGKTISFEFSTANCLKSDSSIISCIDSGIGFDIRANGVSVSSNNTSLICDYTEDQRVRIDIVIEGKKNTYNYKTITGTSGAQWSEGTAEEALLIVFINGVYQGLKILDGDVTFKQNDPKKIIIGSTTCDVNIYNIRIYDFALNIDQIIRNFAYDTPNLIEKIDIQKRNNIFTDIITDTRPEIAVNKLIKARPELPIMYITLDPEVDILPYNKSDWKRLSKTVYDNPMNTGSNTDGNVSFSTEGAVMRNQGTSSMNYPWPWRNWDWKTSDNPFTIGSETSKNWYQYKGMPGGIKKITLKKDYASSEMANNAICSELFDDMAKGVASVSSWIGCLSPAQRASGGAGSEYRLALKAVPIFMFNDKKGDRSELESMGMMNLIPNKSECDYLGFDNYTFEGSRAQEWEVSENHMDWSEKIEVTYDPMTGTISNGLEGNYEARYPKDSTVEWGRVGDEPIVADFGFSPSTTITQSQFNDLYAEVSDLLDFHNWLVDTNRALASDEEDAMKRLDKFKAEADEHMIVDQWLLYYLWREQYWMFDSGAKNLQIYTMDGKKWGVMVRDADTGLGINNVGELMFPPYLEDTDYYRSTGTGVEFVYDGAKDLVSKKQLSGLDGNEVLNGQFGAVWLNLRDVYKSRIEELYRALKANANRTYFTAADSIKRFEDHQDHWCESLYNFGMRQYFGGGAYTSNIDAGVGDKKGQRRSWLTNGFIYRQSKYKALDDYLNFRADTYSTPDSDVSRTINIKTYIPMYIGAGGTSSSMTSVPDKYHIRVTDPEEGVTYNVDDIIPSGDVNTYIFGSSMITDLGDMARVCKWRNVQSLNLPKLIALRLGDHTGTYREYYNNGMIRPVENNSLGSLDCSGIPLLTYLDLTNHRVLGSLNIRNNTLLEELYLRGTDNLKTIVFPQTASLKTVQLGRSINSLTMNGLTGIKSISIEDPSKLETLMIDGCSDEVMGMSYRWVESAIESGTMRVCNIVGVKWESGVKEDVISKLLDIDRLTLTGHIKMDSMSYSLKQRLISRFGEIDRKDNPLYIEYTEVPITGATLPSKIYLYTIGEHSLTFIPNPSNGNTFTKTEWWMDSTDYAEINVLTGVVTVKSISTEDDPVEINYGVRITLKDGSVIEQSAKIGFYQRSCKIGDYVFNDGSYGDEIVSDKTPIGICFYIEPKDATKRLMVGLEDIGRIVSGAREGNWGIGKPSWQGDTNGISNLQLEDDWKYPCYNVDKIRNIDSAGVDYRPDTSQSYINTLDDSIYMNGDNFKNFDKATVYGTIGWEKISGEVEIDGESVSDGEYSSISRYNTLCIIEHRNHILESCKKEIPKSDTYETEYECLNRILGNMSSEADRSYYYCAASYAYAYRPDVNSLDERFGEHKWFLPSVGELVRLCYFISKMGVEGNKYNIFDGKTAFNVIQPGSYWSSTQGVSSIETISNPENTSETVDNKVSNAYRCNCNPANINLTYSGGFGQPVSYSNHTPLKIRPICIF